MANIPDIIFLNLTACHTGERKEKRGCTIRHRYEKGEEKKIKKTRKKDNIQNIKQIERMRKISFKNFTEEEINLN